MEGAIEIGSLELLLCSNVGYICGAILPDTTAGSSHADAAADTSRKQQKNKTND